MHDCKRSAAQRGEIIERGDRPTLQDATLGAGVKQIMPVESRSLHRGEFAEQNGPTIDMCARDVANIDFDKSDASSLHHLKRGAPRLQHTGITEVLKPVIGHADAKPRKSINSGNRNVVAHQRQHDRQIRC